MDQGTVPTRPVHTWHAAGCWWVVECRSQIMGTHGYMLLVSGLQLLVHTHGRLLSHANIISCHATGCCKCYARWWFCTLGPGAPTGRGTQSKNVGRKATANSYHMYRLPQQSYNLRANYNWRCPTRSPRAHRRRLTARTPARGARPDLLHLDPCRLPDRAHHLPAPVTHHAACVLLAGREPRALAALAAAQAADLKGDCKCVVHMWSGAWQ